MRKAERLSPEPEALVAPGEIRELVARLTEQSVDAIPAGEARTLEGVSLETGIPVARLRETLGQMRREGRFAIPPAAWAAFVALAAFGVWAVRHTPGLEPAPVSPPVVAPAPAPAVEPDYSGTVALTNVTYGPDGGNLKVDPDFEPSHPLPPGVSISATVGDVLWGSGDHRADALTKPLSDGDADVVRKDIEELLEYARQAAARRRLAAGPVNLSVNTYGGVGGSGAKMPPPGKENDARAAAEARKTARAAVEALQEQLRQRAQWQRDEGP